MIMGSINGVVHLAVALLFLILAYLLVRGYRDREFLRRFLHGQLQKRVYVDWPLVFLGRFCSALDIPLSGEGSRTVGQPKRLLAEVLFESLLLYGIDAIQYSVDVDHTIRVTLHVLRPVLEQDLMEKKLSHALGAEVQFSWNAERMQKKC